MISDLLDVINNPQDYAARLERGEIHIAPLKTLRGPRKMMQSKADHVAVLYNIATNEEFTPHQRQEQMMLAIDERIQAQVEAHPMTMVIDEALSRELSAQRKAARIIGTT